MQAVGLFREFVSGAREDAPSIADALRRLAKDQTKIVADYLGSVDTFFCYMGGQSDVVKEHSYIQSRRKIFRSDSLIGGLSLKTDGTWVWRKDIEYYVYNYRIALPEEFLMHVGDEQRITFSAEIIIKKSEEARLIYHAAENKLR